MRPPIQKAMPSLYEFISCTDSRQTLAEQLFTQPFMCKSLFVHSLWQNAVVSVVSQLNMQSHGELNLTQS